MTAVIRVLYVDDEPDLLEISKMFLEASGDFSVATIESATAALELIKTEQFDAIISDYQMPGMDGIQFLVEVRKKFGKVPFILFTGRGREEIVILAINNGADFYLQKGGEPQSQFAELAHKIRIAVERRTSDKAYHESENRYHSLVDTMHDCVAVYRALADGEDFEFIEFNKAAEKSENVSRKEVIGRKVTEVFPGVQEFGLLEVFRRVWKTGIPETFPIAFYKDNRISGWRDNFIYKLPSGEIVADYSDETARKLAEEALKKSEEQYRRVVETTGTGYVVLDKAGRVITANQEYLRLTGRSTFADIERRTVNDWTAPYDLERNAREVEKCLITGQVRGLEIDYQKPDGTFQPIEINGSVIQSDSGQIILTLCRDITSRKQIKSELEKKNLELQASYEHVTASEEELRANLDEMTRQEQALRESEDRFHGIYDTITSGVAIYEVKNDGASGKDYIIKDFNKTALLIEGKKKEEVVGKSLSDLRPAIDEYGLIPVFQQVWKSGVPGYFPQKVYIDEKYSSWYENRVFRLQSGEIVAIYDDITERKQAEESLQKSEQDLKAAQAIARLGRWELDLVHNTLHWSDGIYQIFEINPAEFGATYEAFLNCIHPEDRDGVNAAYTNSLITKKPYEISHRLRMKDGRIKWVNEICRTEYDSKGQPLRSVGIVQDITEIKQAEEKLKASEEKYRLLFTSMIDGFALLEMIYNEQGKAIDGRYIDVNPAHEKLTGLKRDAIIGHTVRESIPGLEDYWIENYGHVDKTGSPEYFENYVAGLNSWYGVFAYRTSPGFVAVTFKNITERKKAETALKEGEARLRFLVSSTPVTIYTAQASGDFDATFVSENIRQILGYEPDEFTKVPGFWQQNIHPDDVPRVNYEILQLFDTDHYGHEYRFRHKDGTWRWMRDDLRLIRNDDGTPHEVIGSWADITKRKLAEEKLLELQAAVDQAFDGIAIADPKGYITFANSSWAKMHGYSRDELTGRHLSMFHTKEQLELEVIPFNNEVKIKGAWEGEVGHLRKDGTVFSSWMSSAVLQNDKGKTTGIIGMARDITERKVAEQELKLAQQRLKEAHRLAHIGTWDWVIENDKVTWSEELCNISGWDPKKPAPSYAELPRVYTPASWDMLSSAVTRALNTGEPYNLELELVHPDGTRRWANAFGGVKRDADGKITGLHGTLQDITERKVAEESLRETKDYLENLISYANAPIIVWNPDFEITRFNHAFEDMTGRTEHQVLGKRLEILFPTESCNASMDLIQKAHSGEQWKVVEIPILHVSSGEVRIVLWNSANILTPDGTKVVATIAQGQDITERKRVEESLRETKDYLENLISYANAPIIVWNPDFEITRFNHAFEDLTGRTEQQVLGKHLKILFPPKSCNASMNLIKKTYTGEQWKVVEIPIIHAITGEVRIVLWNSANILTPDRTKVVATIAQGQDITERKELEKEMEYHALELRNFSTSLATANKKLTLLSSITRHDINNQMTSLRGYTTLLQRKQPDPSFAEYFTKINAAAERISAMIQFTREYDSIGVNAPVWQDCRIIVDNAAKDAPLGKIIVRNDFPAGAEVFADPLIVKVFYNLMDNAVRYGKKITTIRFSVCEAGEDHLVVCEDDGVGVLSEEKEKIFERGFGKNTGLGLFLSREILGISGITIKETGEPGKGARFEMTIPKGMWRMKMNGAQ